MTGQEGRTLLHHMAMSGNEEMVKALVQAGADLDTQDKVR